MGATKIVKVKKFSFKRLLLVLLIIYCIVYAFYYMLTLPIKNIYIKGCNRITDNEVIELSLLKKYPSLLKISSYKIEKNLKTLPLVKEVRVKKNILGKVTIIIDEYKILFYDLNNNKIILEDGIEIDDSNKYKGIPTLTNYVPSNIYKRLTKALLKIDEDVLSLISEIEYSVATSNEKVIDDTRFMLKMNDGNIVYANILNIKNLNHYKEIYSTLNNEKGYLYLDSSNEENFYFQRF